MSDDQKNLPEKKFSTGAVVATVWKNKVERDGQVESYRTVSLERRYMNKATNEWRSTNSFRLNDLPKAALVLNKAYEYLVLRESDQQDSSIQDVDQDEIEEVI